MNTEFRDRKAKEGFCCGCGLELTSEERHYYGNSCNACEEKWHHELNAELDSERKKLLGAE